MHPDVAAADLSCRDCGNRLRALARFCDACGLPVAPPVRAGERKHVTVLFVDVVESMKLAAALDPERLRDIMHELFNRAAAEVQRYHGTVDKFTGDGLMALFGAPAALEDHALRACLSGLAIQAAAQTLAGDVRSRDHIELRVRVGINSGEVVAGAIGVGPGRYTAVGHTVGLAQRMEAAARPGTVLCTEGTARLAGTSAVFGPTESVRIKGSADPLAARDNWFRCAATNSVIPWCDRWPTAHSWWRPALPRISDWPPPSRRGTLLLWSRTRR